MTIGSILKEALGLNASDIILAPNNYPSVKVDGEVQFLSEHGRLSKDDLNRDILSIMWNEQKKAFAEQLELDFGIELQGYGRFRANAFVQKNGYSIVFRTITSDIPHFEDLDLPESILWFTAKKSWLVLVTGSVWSGKSTTLASLIHHINHTYNKHIITIEDPVEFIHDSYKSLIEQREVWINTKTFWNGLKYALRQASDVIMLGEMRDIETFRLALRAAETGNLVLATLHTSWAARTISRIIDMFPADERAQIRAQLSESLVWVVWQDLIKKEGGWRVVASEVLVNNTSIANMIRDENVHQINSVIETGKDDGMVTMKKSLERLYGKGLISEEKLSEHLKK